MKEINIILFLLFILLNGTGNAQEQTTGKNEYYKNPVIHADYSDPDVIRVGDDYYMTSSSFAHTPCLPILHSRDLVNWEIINHAAENIPYGNFEKPMRGNGVWAPCLRYHNGEYYIYYGDPDYGIFMTKTKNPYGKWETVKLVKEAKGWIDPSPLWDEDGNAYLVHAWARSRSGIKHRLTLNKMNPEGTEILDSGITIYEDSIKHPTLEGPKFYKRNGYYYILAPAGGVPTGWQAAFRSKNIYGPYEDKIVMEQGSASVNGPHQGGLVDTKSGEEWFIHFQDKGAYGRIVHLQPVWWVNNWPVIGIEKSKPGCGEPVAEYKFPNVNLKNSAIKLQTSDEFDSSDIGLQWQWEANHKKTWYSLTENKGALRLYSQKNENRLTRIWDMPHVIGQKFPAASFTAVTKLNFLPRFSGERAGLVVLGLDYFSIYIINENDKFSIILIRCIDANKDGKEEILEKILIDKNTAFLKLDVDSNTGCIFSFSTDGTNFKKLGNIYTAKKGLWVGAKVALFTSAPENSESTGFTDFEYFRISDCR